MPSCRLAIDTSKSGTDNCNNTTRLKFQNDDTTDNTKRWKFKVTFYFLACQYNQILYKISTIIHSLPVAREMSDMHISSHKEISAF